MTFKTCVARVSVLLAMAMLLPGITLAQPQQMRMTPEERALQLKERLSLDEAQTKKVTEILRETQNEMMEVMEEFQDDRDAMRAVMREVSQKSDKKIEALLTDDQKIEYNDPKGPLRGKCGKEDE